MKKIILLFALMIGTLSGFGQSIKVKDTSIKDGDVLSSISELTIEFDFSEAAASLGMDENELGIASSMKDFFKKRMLLYKGEKDEEYVGGNQDPGSEENILQYGFKTVGKSEVVAGEHSISIPFQSTIDLIEGEKYTIYIPASMFLAGIPGTPYTNTVYKEPIIIEVIGGQGDTKSLKLESASPASQETISSLEHVTLTFDQDVTVEEGASINLTSNGVVCATSNSVYAEGNTVHILFDTVELYTRKDYILEIPAGIVKSADGELESSSINLFYKGAAYHYLTYGRVRPTNNSSLSWLSQLYMRFTCPDDYNIGNAGGELVKLYEGSLEADPVMVECSTDQIDTFQIEPWKFDLKPSTTYYLVIEEGTIFPMAADYKTRLLDTTNPRIVLTYTTPEVLETPNKVAFAAVEPNEGEFEHLDQVALNLDRYEFESTFYEVWMADRSATAILSDGETETAVPFTFKDGTTAATIALDCDLAPGKEYTLTIPANTFVPHCNENLAAVAGNDEVVLTFKGKGQTVAEPEFVTIALNIGDYASVAYRMVKGQESVLDVKPGNDWKLESLSLNGEDVTPDVADNGLYTLPALEADATLDAVYAYAHEIAYDYDTAVGNIEAVPFRLGNDGNAVVITGLQGGETIAVYTLGGMKVAALDAVPADMHRATLTLPVGQAYIILVDGVSVKYRH